MNFINFKNNIKSHNFKLDYRTNMHVFFMCNECCCLLSKYTLHRRVYFYKTCDLKHERWDKIENLPKCNQNKMENALT